MSMSTAITKLRELRDHAKGVVQTAQAEIKKAEKALASAEAEVAAYEKVLGFAERNKA